MRNGYRIVVILMALVFLSGCFGTQKIEKPLEHKTITEQVIQTAKIEQKPLYVSLLETKTLPNIFIIMIVGGVFVLVFLGKSDTGIRLGLALIASGIVGLVVSCTYQRHAEVLAKWSIIITISTLCIAFLLLAAMFYVKYVKTSKAFKEVVQSAVPAFAALKEKAGVEVAKAIAWTKQSDDTIQAVEEIKAQTKIDETKGS